MARVGYALGLAMVIMTTMWSQSWAQSCTPAVVSLAPCFNYITGNSSVPSTMCCSQLAAIAQSQTMMCLCMVFTIGASQLGIPLNQSQTLALPGVCKVRVPSLGQCTATSATPTTSAASPGGSLAPVSPSTPSVPSDASSPSPTQSTPSVPSIIPSGSGSKTIPRTGVASSARSSTRMTPSLLLLLFIASASALSRF